MDIQIRPALPQDVPALIERCGGKERFVERLNYACENRLVEMWNEPAFLTLRLFSYAGRPDLTSKWVRQTMRSGCVSAAISRTQPISRACRT